jgi:S1-C subfamily serine protease
MAVASRATALPVESTLAAATIFANSRSAVVTIVTQTSGLNAAHQGSRFFIASNQFASRYRAHSSGAFFVLTNYHVIKSTESASVQLGTSWKGDAEWVVTEDEANDVAVFECPMTKIVARGGNSSHSGLADVTPIKAPTQLTLAELDPRVGERVFTLGSPQSLDATFSEGTV